MSFAIATGTDPCLSCGPAGSAAYNNCLVAQYAGQGIANFGCNNPVNPQIETGITNAQNALSGVGTLTAFFSWTQQNAMRVGLFVAALMLVSVGLFVAAQGD